MSVFQRKNGIWEYDFQHQGARYTKKLPEAKTRAQAQRMERAVRAKIEAGSTPDAASKMSLNDACMRWYDEVGQHRKSWQDIQRSLDLIVTCIPGITKLRDIDEAVVIDAIRARRCIPTGRGNGEVKNTTINRQIIEVLRSIHKRAELWGATSLQRIDWKAIMLPVGKPKKVEISDEQGDALDAVMQPHWQAFRQFIATYGLRLQEMFFAPEAIYIGNDGIVRIRLPERKADDEHIIPLDEEDGREMLARKSRAQAAGLNTVWYREHKGRLEPCTYSGAKSAFRRATRKTGVPWTAHDHRHHAATMITRESDIENARMLLGHSSIATTQRYVHAKDKDLQDALSRAKSRQKSRSRKRETG